MGFKVEWTKNRIKRGKKRGKDERGIKGKSMCEKSYDLSIRGYRGGVSYCIVSRDVTLHIDGTASHNTSSNGHD